MEHHLTRQADDHDWRQLAHALLAILLADPRSVEPLDSSASGVVERVASVLAGDLALPDNAWLAIPLAATIGTAVAVLGGHADTATAAVLEDGLERLQADPGYATTATAISRLLAVTADDDPDAGQELVFDLDPAGLAAIELILLHTAEA